jgi:hypothetical protein
VDSGTWNLIITIAAVWSGLLALVVGFLAAAQRGARRSNPVPVRQTRIDTSAGFSSDRLDARSRISASEESGRSYTE